MIKIYAEGRKHCCNTEFMGAYWGGKPTTWMCTRKIGHKGPHQWVRGERDHKPDESKAIYTEAMKSGERRAQQGGGDIMKLTFRQLFEMNKKYLHSGGRTCPVCDKGNIASDENMHLSAGHVKQRIYCSNCEATWYDVYRFVEIENIVVGSVIP